MQARPVRTLLIRALLALSALLVLALCWALAAPGGPALPATGHPALPDAGQAARGAYLALQGNCAGCHTARGGAAMAGGRPIETPYGSVVSANLTPHPEQGLGGWSVQAFRRALRQGLSRDGHRISPTCPYANFTLITDDDAQALYAHLQSLPVAAQPKAASTLRWPFGTQMALAVWQWFALQEGPFQPDPQRSAAWNRGAYLAGGLGHCSACHGSRNWRGATSGPFALDGASMPGHRWQAPALDSAAEAGVAGWPAQDVVDFLRRGSTARGTAQGPMAEVVLRSTQYWREEDLLGLTAFLQALPQQPVAATHPPPRTADGGSAGRRLYEDHCADCHGAQGEGAAPAYPGLAGNRILSMGSPLNALRVVMAGGFAPATAGNPRPYGMPPYGHRLDDAELAALLSYLRQTWGQAAAPVTAQQVQQWR